MKTLNDYTDELTSKLFADNGAFFAFGNRQFDEQKQEGVIYISLASGLLCPKVNATKVNQELDRIFEEAVKQQVAEFGAEKIISHEYFNHETQITGDIDQVVGVLAMHRDLFPDLFTAEVILKTCKQCFNEAVANDWF